MNNINVIYQVNYVCATGSGSGGLVLIDNIIGGLVHGPARISGTIYPKENDRFQIVLTIEPPTDVTSVTGLEMSKALDHDRSVEIGITNLQGSAFKIKDDGGYMEVILRRLAPLGRSS